MQTDIVICRQIVIENQIEIATSVDNSRCDESETIEPKCRLRLL